MVLKNQVIGSVTQYKLNIYHHVLCLYQTFWAQNIRHAVWYSCIRLRKVLTDVDMTFPMYVVSAPDAFASGAETTMYAAQAQIMCDTYMKYMHTWEYKYPVPHKLKYPLPDYSTYNLNRRTPVNTSTMNIN